MREERNILHTKAYPILREFCSGKGLDFLVSDMRWGITDDAISGHSLVDICLKEVVSCKLSSVGPNFVVKCLL